MDYLDQYQYASYLNEQYLGRARMYAHINRCILESEDRYNDQNLYMINESVGRS